MQPTLPPACGVWPPFIHENTVRFPLFASPVFLGTPEVFRGKAPSRNIPPRLGVAEDSTEHMVSGTPARGAGIGGARLFGGVAALDHRLFFAMPTASERARPSAVIGKPEPLKHALRGYWSRRIDSEHRQSRGGCPSQRSASVSLMNDLSGGSPGGRWEVRLL